MSKRGKCVKCGGLEFYPVDGNICCVGCGHVMEKQEENEAMKEHVKKITFNLDELSDFVERLSRSFVSMISVDGKGVLSCYKKTTPTAMAVIELKLKGEIHD